MVHADSFNTVYFTILHLLLVWMLLMGFSSISMGLESGHSSIGAWWPWLLHVSTDWTLTVCGGNMGVRESHHKMICLILAWTMLPICYQIWRTIFWREGDIAFGGEKFVKSA